MMLSASVELWERSSPVSATFTGIVGSLVVERLTHFFLVFYGDGFLVHFGTLAVF